MIGSRSKDAALQGEKRHVMLEGVAGLGVVVVLIMLFMAFGPSAIGFGVIVFLIAFAFMARRYQFSLRTILIVVTVLCIWLGLKGDRDGKLNRAITSISNSGGRLTVHYRRADFPWGLWKDRYRLDFDQLKEELSESEFASLKVLAPASLQWLDLSNTGITDESLKYIEGHVLLEYLSLANETYMSGEVIPDRPQNLITDAGLARLGRLTELKGIDLRGTNITDAGLKLLSKMPKLEWIYLDGTNVQGPGIAHLRNHKHLIMLELNGCKLLPIGYQELLQHSNLLSLGLRNSGATDAELKLMAGLNHLGILRLNDTNVTAEGIKEFATAFPDCKIEH